MALTGSRFRWAWQNFHITTKVTDDQRSEQSTRPRKPSKPSEQAGTKKSEPTGSDVESRRPKRPRRPPVSLKKGLTNLHLLLRVPSFNRWPLAVRFFCSDVHKAWEQYSKKASGELRKGLLISLDERKPAEPNDETETSASPRAGRKRKFAPSGDGGIEGLDITYSKIKSHLQKSASLIAEEGAKQCYVCADQLDLRSSTVINCPSERCQALYHMVCLARMSSRGQIPGGPLLPVQICCPQCHTEHQWVDLVRELSLRARGENDIAQLLKAPRMRKVTAISSSKDPHDVVERGDAISNERILEDVLATEVEDDPLPEDWHEIEEDSDQQSVASTDTGISSRCGSPIRSTRQRQQLPAVIEDSEWDSAEVLD